MFNQVVIEESKNTEENLHELAELLIDVVNKGASIGFLPPLSYSDAVDYWENVRSPDVVWWIAKVNGVLAGTIQLHLCTKENGTHRAEIAKLMTHSNYRKRGIARLLMNTAEERASKENRSLIVLDTREGDASNSLYKSLGYIEAGKIPGYARSADGSYDATIFYYKDLKERSFSNGEKQ